MTRVCAKKEKISESLYRSSKSDTDARKRRLFAIKHVSEQKQLFCPGFPKSFSSTPFLDDNIRFRREILAFQESIHAQQEYLVFHFQRNLSELHPLELFFRSRTVIFRDESMVATCYD